MTQENIAEILDMNLSSIKKWEYGKCQIPFDKLKALSEVFSDSVESILLGKEPIEKELSECFKELPQYIKALPPYNQRYMLLEIVNIFQKMLEGKNN